jgi:PAS domain S-box-containing protein
LVVPTKLHTASKKTLLRGRLGFVVVVLAGLAASLIAYAFARHTEQRRIRYEFHRRAEVRHALIRENMRGYEECLYNLRNLFANSADVTPLEFSASTSDIRTRHPGIQALQWVPVVPGPQRAEVEEWARRELVPFYGFTERGADGTLVPAAERPLYYPILYIDPLAGNEPALGFDLKIGPSHLDIERSLRTRGLVMTGKIRLVQEKSGANGFGVIMICPVFRTAAPANDLIGFVQIVFKIDDMMEQSWVSYPARALDTLILDITQRGADPFLYSRRPNHAAAVGRPLQSPADFTTPDRYVSELSIGGRVWECHYAPTAGWTQSQSSATPPMVFLGGLVFTFVLSAYFLSVRRRSELVEQQVNERTAELRHTQGLLEADITKRQSVEAELRESRRQLDSLLSQMPGMAYRYVNHTPPTALFISRGSIEIIGFTPHELVSGNVCYDELILAEDRTRRQDSITAALATQNAYENEYRLRDKHGRVKWVLDRGQGIYSNEGQLLFIEGLAIDITSRKQAEADKAALDRKLLESQKLESLGVLAGGIAHDFNNLLTTIIGTASIVRADLPDHSPIQPHLGQIENGARRAAELCQQMLAYSGKGRFLVQRTSLEKLVRDTIPLLEHSISKRADLHFEFRPNVPDVEVDATQIRQIIMNLVVNASDAIGDQDGVITVETSTLSRNDPHLIHAALPPPPGEGDLVCLRVRDTGAGMTRETIAKIFDPFFTTKFAGRGLGLAAVLGIVRGHHGGLLVTSAVGAGSTFTLLLPAATRPAPEKEIRPPVETRDRPLSGTVLLIDDEEGVRAVAEQMFCSFGLKTFIAADGKEGFELFKQHQATISLVLLDLTMPRMSGEETLRAIRAISPRLPVILTSGYNESAIPELATDPHVSFLQKPFSMQALRAQIAAMLG